MLPIARRAPWTGHPVASAAVNPVDLTLRNIVGVAVTVADVYDVYQVVCRVNGESGDNRNPSRSSERVPRSLRPDCLYCLMQRAPVHGAIIYFVTREIIEFETGSFDLR